MWCWRDVECCDKSLLLEKERETVIWGFLTMETFGVDTRFWSLSKISLEEEYATLNSDVILQLWSP